MRWDVLWCAGTNAFCMFPTVFAYRKNLDEWLLYLSTGLASVFYHLHHFNKYLPPACNFMLYRPIRAIDLVLSDMSVCWITSAMTGTGRQLKVFLLFLPSGLPCCLVSLLSIPLANSLAVLCRPGI